MAAHWAVCLAARWVAQTDGRLVADLVVMSAVWRAEPTASTKVVHLVERKVFAKVD